ncbi:MAG: serine hydrolase domain-containing protein, partial [Bacteroidota bacterium]
MSPFIRGIFCGLLFVFCLPLTGQDNEKIDDYLQSVIAAHEVPGMAVAVVKGDRVIYENYFGLAELNHRVPVSEQTIFRVYSTTKVLVAMAIFQLEEKRKLRVEDPIGKYLTDLPEAWNDRKIKDLLAHSSGLPNFLDFEKGITTEDMIAQLAAEPIIFAAGEHYVYNQTNYWLLGRIIEQASGLSLEAFVTQYQLGGTREGFAFSSNARLVSPNRTGQYFKSAEGWLLSIDEAEEYAHAANGLAISLPTFIAWAKRLHAGELLGEAHLSKLISPYTFKNKESEFFHGWGSYPIKNQRSAGFTGGWVSGYRYFPAQDMSVIYLSNGLRYLPVHNTVIDHVAGIVDS